MQIQISWLLQKPTDLDLHCLPRQGISGFSRIRVKKHAYSFYLIFAFENNFCAIKVLFVFAVKKNFSTIKVQLHVGPTKRKPTFIMEKQWRHFPLKSQNCYLSRSSLFEYGKIIIYSSKRCFFFLNEKYSDDTMERHVVGTHEKWEKHLSDIFLI